MPPWTPPADAVEVKSNTPGWTPPADAVPVEDPLKKKESTVSTSLSTPQVPGLDQQSPSGSPMEQPGSASTNPLARWGGENANIPAPSAQLVSAPPNTTAGSNIPNFALFENPFLNHTDWKATATGITDQGALATQKQSGAHPVKLTPEQIKQQQALGLDPLQTKTIDGQVLAIGEGYNKNLAYNMSIAADQERVRLLEQTPGTPEYNAKAYPGAALPVQSEDPLVKARRYYDSYLAQYEPQKRRDYIETTQGQASQVEAAGAFQPLPNLEMVQGDNTDEKIILQKTQAQHDQEALQYVGQGAFTNLNNAATTLDTKYKPQMEAAKELNQWPTDQEGKPVIQDQQQLLRYQSLVQQIQNDKEFINTFAQASVSRAHLEEVRKAGQTYLDQYPEWRDQFNLLKDAEKSAQDDVYGQSWLSGNIVNPVIRTVASAVESLAYIPKAIGSAIETSMGSDYEYGWTDALYDKANLIYDTKAAVLFPTAGDVSSSTNPYTGEEQQIFDEDFLPGLTASVTQMGLILAGGEVPAAIGLDSIALAKVTQVAAASTLAMNHFYEAGKASGMSEQEAQNFSIVSGIISGSFMAVNPIGVSAAEGNTIVTKSVEAYASALAEQGTVSAARQAAVKSLANEIVGVNMVGVAQKLSEYGTNYLANIATGANLDTGENIGKDMWDVVVMSTIMGAGFGSVRYGKDIVSPRKNESRPYLEALYTAAKDPVRYKDALMRMHESGDISVERMNFLRDQIDNANSALQTAPEILSPAQKAQMLPKLMEKQQLLKQEKVTDSSLKPVVEKQIEDIDAEIRDIAEIKTEEEVKLEGDKEAQDLIDYQELSLEKAVLGDLEPAKLLRHEKLSEKFSDSSSDSPLKKELRKMGVDDKLINAISNDTVLKETLFIKDANIMMKIMAAGVHDRATNIINISKIISSITGGRDKALLHEVVHAGTVDLYRDIIKSPSNYTPEQIKAVDNIHEYYSTYRSNTSPVSTISSGKLYGLTNAYEFMAEFISNSKFRKHIAETAPEEKVGFIRHIWNNILDMLGLSSKNINQSRLNDISSNIDVILQASADKYKASDDVQSNDVISEAETKPSKLFSEPNPETAIIADKYLSSKGIESPSSEIVTKVDPENSKRIADEFQKLEDSPNDPKTKAAYEALVNETNDQAKSIIDSGYKIEIYKGEGEPYASSEAMIKDLKDNKHLFVLSSEGNFGGSGITEESKSQHPLLRDSGLKDVNGESLLNNDVFRFVHDFFGHSERGNGFGPVGEENAWLIHSRMYSDEARRAMTTETRGQNSWANFGEHIRNEDGTIKKKGDQGYLSPKDRPFAEQKMGLMSDDIVFPERVEKRGNVNKSGPKSTDIIDTEVVKEDSTEVVDRLEKDIEVAKQIALGKIDVKRKAVEGRINEAVKNKQLTNETADVYRKAISDIADGRKKAVKESVNKKIDQVAEALISKLGGTDHVIGPDGTKIPIVKNSIIDVERLIKKSAEIIKAAVSKGIDMNIAINNMMAAIKSHPAFRSMNEQDKAAFEERFREEYSKVAVEMKDEIDALDTKEGRTVGRALESPFVDQVVKDELIRLGTDYVPVKNKIAEQDARRIVEFFKESGETAKLEEAVRNVGNGMQIDSRGAVLVELVKDYTAETKSSREAIDKAVTPEEKAAAELSHKQIADKLASLTHHAGEIGTQIGRYMQYVHKSLKKIFESAPQDVVRMMIDEQVKLRAKEAAKDNQGKVRDVVDDINSKIVDGKIKAEDIDAALSKHLPGFSEENKAELSSSIAKTVEETGKLDKTSLNNTYENVLSKEIMSPEMKKYVEKNIDTLHEYDKKTIETKKKIEAYKDAVNTEKQAYADAIKDGNEIAPDQRQVLSQARESAHTEALNAAQEVQSFELKAQEAQENIVNKLRGPRNIWNTMASMMTGNMLRMKSLAVNVLSYIPTIALRGVGGSLGSMADWIEVKSYNAFQKMRGSEKRLGRSVDVLAQIEGAYKYGLRPGHQEAFRRVLTGGMSSDLGKLEGHATINFVNAWKDLVAKRSPAETRFIENRATAALEATVGVPADIVFRLLQLGDAPPRKMAESGKLLEIAKQKGLNEAEQLEFMFFPDEGSQKIAQEFGKKATYQNDNVVSEKVRGLLHVFSTMAEKAGNRHLAGAIRLAETTISPFVKTPINIISEVVTYSNPAVPLVMAGMKVKEAVKAAKNGNTEAATRYRGEANMYFAKSIIGMGIATIAMSFVRKGLMTPGYNREDSEVEKLVKEQSVKPSSLNVSAFNRMMAGDPDWEVVNKNDYWMNYGKMGSFGMALNVWAETLHDKEIPKDGSGMPMAYLGLMADAGLNTVSTSFDQSFLTGTSTLMDAMHSKDYDRIIPNTLMAFTSIALPGTVMDISKSEQDAQKVTTVKDDPIQTYKNKLALGAFRGDELQDKVGLFGETLPSAPRGTTPIIYNAIDPYGFYQPGGNSVTDKVIDFYAATPRTSEGRNKILPPVPQQTMTINGQSVMLTDKEFHDFKVMVGSARAAYVRPYMSADFPQDDYETRVDMLSRFYKDGYKDAKDLFIETTPRLLNMLFAEEE